MAMTPEYYEHDMQALRDQRDDLLADCRRMRAAISGSTVRLYDANYERYLADLTSAAVESVGDAAESGDEHLSALVRQLTEAVGALRRSRDELRRDLNTCALAANSRSGDVA